MKSFYEIEPTAAAANLLLIVSQQSKNGTLSLVGAVTTETVAIEQPAVGLDVGELNKDNDAHWMAAKYDGDALVLNSDNTLLGFPFVGVFRLKKSAGVSDNEFGVRYYG